MLLKWSQDRMDQVRKDQLSKRHSIAVPTNTIRVSVEEREDVAGEEESSNRRQRKKPVAKNTVSKPPTAKSPNKIRSISFSHGNRKVSAKSNLTNLKEDSED